jgi:PAS domain S-box-containing protein
MSALMPANDPNGQPVPAGDQRLLEPYRLFSQHARDIVLFIRADGSIVEANDAAIIAYGYNRQEILSLTIFDLRDPATSHLVSGQMLQADSRGFTFETVHRRKDGTTFPVEVSARGAEVAGERLLLSIIRDITEREKVERELRESEARYRDLFENANDIIYTLDLEGRITSVNRRAEETFGYTRVECVGRNVAELIPAEYHARMHEALRQKLAGEASPTVYELEMIARDGWRIPLEVSSRLIERDGQPVGIQGIARDISDRRRAEQALRQSEERLRLALDAGRCGVWDWNIPENRVTWSERIYEFHGLVPGTFGGRVEDFSRLIHPEDAPGISEAIRRAVEEGDPYSEEFRIVRPSGEVRWISTHGRVLREGDRPVRMLGATIDVTERRAAEEALREADRRKDEFLAMLAHELRNPLAPIRNAVEVMKLIGPADPELEMTRNMIERQVTHLARLVDDLLDVSRITRGKVLLRTQRLDLTALSRSVIEDHQSLLEEAGLKVAVELPRIPLWLEGDPTRLAQVVGNLLHNAVKFTDSGGGVTISLGLEPATTTAVLSVRDTGIGMEPGLLGRLFEPFSQADRSLDRTRGGLGLGLALVKGLVELHGGTVRANSAGVGKGSEFVIRLPLAEKPRRNERSVSALAGKRSVRVLIIEDSRDVAESLRLLLTLSGHQVEVAFTGQGGIELARPFRPDVVLCDIGLPGMDGYAVARAMRADPELCKTTLFALSGYGQEEDQLRAHQAGFDRHLTKPADPALLLGLLVSLPGRDAH